MVSSCFIFLPLYSTVAGLNLRGFKRIWNKGEENQEQITHKWMKSLVRNSGLRAMLEI